jgi:hypothetical protein
MRPISERGHGHCPSVRMEASSTSTIVIGAPASGRGLTFW